MSRRILVTGASGFIGRALASAFLQRGEPLRAALRRPARPVFPGQIEVFEHGDLAEPIDWRPALEGIDKVIHLAGIAHAGRGVSTERYDRVNRLATERLANAAARAGIDHFVFVSSIRAQAGPCADHVLSERGRETPTDSYGRSKLAAEAAVRAAGVPYTTLRPVALYGPGAKGNVALLGRAAASLWPLPLGNFTNRRSLLGVDNFVSATRFVLGAPAAIGETYVVSDPGVAPRLSEVVATMREARGRRPGLLPLPPSLLEIPLRIVGRGELWQRFGGGLQVDAGKLLALGWRPAHDTLEGLAAMVRTDAPRRPNAAGTGGG